MNNAGLALNSSFVLREGCICPQAVNDTQNFVYECTTIGPISTTWRGSAFNCPGNGNEILLRHSRFTMQGGDSGQCNNGNIMGRSLGVDDNCYTSQLSVTYSPALRGTSIMCVHNNGASQDAETVIGQSPIDIRTGTYLLIVYVGIARCMSIQSINHLGDSC